MKGKRLAVKALGIGLLVGCAFAAHAQAPPGIYIGSGTTADKPQSKLWYNDGTWWAILPDGADVYFYRLVEGVLVKQTFPHAMVHTSNSARADVVWDGTHLFVLMYKGSTMQLSKYGYNAGTYTRLAGFPVSIPIQGKGAETATLAKDSTEKLWIAYEAGTKIRVIWSTTPDHRGWNTTGTVLYEPVNSDDIAAIVAFDNKIGVLWSNQAADNFGFRVHTDGEEETEWGPVEVLKQGGKIADDHINLTVTTTQDVLAITKSGVSNGVNLFVRWHDGGWEGPYLVSSGATRPIVLYSQDDQEVYVVYTVMSKPTTIAYKKASLLDLASLRLTTPTTVLEVAGISLNDVTSTKDEVSLDSGLVVVAKGGTKAYYTVINLD